MSIARPLIALLLPALLMVGGCKSAPDAGPVQVDVIGKPRELADPLRYATRPAGQVMLGATAQSLLRFDAHGEIVNGLAESWIVQDDGRTYILRLSRARWAKGGSVRADAVATLLRRRMAAHDRLLGGLKPTVRAMTDHVIEIDLNAPIPSFLQLLAQPAMAISGPSGGTGPFAAIPRGPFVALSAPDATEEPDESTTATQQAAHRRRLYLRALRPASAVARFAAGRSDLVLGGRFQHWPYVGLAKIAAAEVRSDPVDGLFGLLFDSRSDFLSNPDVREAINMAIDRDRLAAAVMPKGWKPTLALLPGQIDLSSAPSAPAWADNAMAQRRGYAQSVVSHWRSGNRAAVPVLRIALPAGPGARMLFRHISQDLRAIGLDSRLVDWDAPAELRLVDEVAPFDSALWYIARIGCAETADCSKDAERALDVARSAPDEDALGAALVKAEVAALKGNAFIPLGQPVRFALVSPRLTGFMPSPRARHPLNMLFAETR